MWKGIAERALPTLVRETRPLRAGVAKFLGEDPESLRKKLAEANDGVVHHTREVEHQTSKLARLGPQTDLNFRDVAPVKSDLRWHENRLAEETRKRNKLERRLGVPVVQVAAE